MSQEHFVVEFTTLNRKFRQILAYKIDNVYWKILNLYKSEDLENF